MRKLTRAQALWTTAALFAPNAALGASPVAVGVNGDEGMAQVFYAQDLGLFEKHAIDVNIEILRNGAAIVAAVVGGDVQVGASNVISLLQAMQRGVPISIIAGGAAYDPSNETEKIVVLAGGPIRTAKDLTGKVVGTPSLSSTAALAVYAWLDKNGGDSTSVRFIEVPQATMGPALEQGRIAAAAMEDPDLDAAGVQLRELGQAYGAVARNYMLTAWFASNAWLEQNAATARFMRDALHQAGQWAMTHRSAAAGVFEKYTKKQLAQARESFAPAVTPALLQPVFDAAFKYKLVAQKTNAADTIWKAR